MKKIDYPKILAEMYRSRWAMSGEALKGAMEVLHRGITAEDREFFHLASEDQKNALVAYTGEPVDGLREVYKRGQVGTMFLDGPIIPRATMISEISGIASVESLTKNFKALQNDPEVKNIVLMIDSPGGQIVGISEFSQLLRESQKPVTAFVYGMAASAGYWIATGAHKIVVADTAELGSIGVVVAYRDQSKKLESQGVKEIEFVSSQSPNKRPDPATAEGRGEIQRVVDDLADVFVNAVAKNRKVEVSRVLEDFGAGGMLVGAKAVEAGMADQVSTLEKFLNSISAGPSANARPRINAEQQREVPKMEEDKKTPCTVEDLKKEHPEAVQELEKNAAVKERERIQAIEGLNARVEKTPAAVRNAIRQCIDENKFLEGATAESVGLLVLEAMGEAQSKQAHQTADGARALATVAGNLPADAGEASQPGTNHQEKQEKERAAGLADAMEKTKKQGVK